MIGHERAFEEWLADIETMAGLGCPPLLSVLRREDGAIEIHSPALGPPPDLVSASVAESWRNGATKALAAVVQ